MTNNNNPSYWLALLVLNASKRVEEDLHENLETFGMNNMGTKLDQIEIWKPCSALNRISSCFYKIQTLKNHSLPHTSPVELFRQYWSPCALSTEATTYMGEDGFIKSALISFSRSLSNLGKVLNDFCCGKRWHKWHWNGPNGNLQQYNLGNLKSACCSKFAYQYHDILVVLLRALSMFIMVSCYHWKLGLQLNVK